MHVGLDGTPLLGRLTGIGWYTYDLLAALADEFPQDRFTALPISWRTAGNAEVPSRPNVRLRRAFAPARPLRAVWEHWPVPPLEALLSCDVFHATNFVAPPAWRTPVVVTVHDLWFRHRPDHVPAVERRLTDLLPKVTLRADAVVTVSHHVADELSRWLPHVGSKLHVVPLAPHPRTAPPRVVALPDGPPFALVLGTVNRRKNFPAALDALLAARSAGSDVRLVVAGGVDPTVDLEAELRQRSLDYDDVLPLGYVDDGQVRWLLENAAALVSSSLHEGFGLPALEAMAAGLPVVAFTGGAVAEVCDDAAVLVPHEAAPQLGDALHDILSSPVRAGNLRRAGLKRAAEFSWVRTAHETRDIYSSVL